MLCVYLSETDAMTLLKYCLLFVALLATAGTAWGKDLERREKTARAACLSGDYAKGAAILSELFVKTEDAVFIYDQGRCFEQNRRCEEAIARFEEYLRVAKKLSKAEKAEAQKHIADCQNLVTKQATSATPGGTGLVCSADQGRRSLPTCTWTPTTRLTFSTRAAASSRTIAIKTPSTAFAST